MSFPSYTVRNTKGTIEFQKKTCQNQRIKSSDNGSKYTQKYEPWVWIGLKTFIFFSKKIDWNWGLLRADNGNGCKSISSVGGGYFSGRIRWRNEMGRIVSLPNHRSETVKYEKSIYQVNLSENFLIEMRKNEFIALKSKKKWTLLFALFLSGKFLINNVII